MATIARVPGFDWQICEEGSSVVVSATSAQGESAAEAKLTLSSPSETEHRAAFEGVVGAEFTGRGLGRALMTWAEAETRERLAAPIAAGHTVTFRADAESPGDRAVALYRATGLALVVAEDEMGRELHGVPERGFPEGMCTLAWGDMTAPLFFHAYDGAFRDRPGFPGWDEARWRASFTEPEVFSPEHSLVVMDGPEPAAFAVCWVEEGTGWITQMGVRAGWRGRGLGEALISRALRAFAGAGLQRAALEVATNNPHARRLYERMGFVTTSSWQSWQKQL